MSGRIVTASTEDVPRDRRREYWEDVVARVHLRMEMAPKSDTDFTASLFAVSLDDVTLVQITSTAHSGKRSKRSKDEQGRERCFFIAAQRGQVMLRQEERESLLEPGDMALLDSRLASEYSAAGPVAFLGVSFPRTELTQRIGGLERLNTKALAHGAPMHRFTYHYLERLLTFAPEIDTPELFRMKSHMLDLIAVTVGRLRVAEVTGSAYKASLLHRMKAFVEERLHDPRLDIRAVADRFRVSPRYVSQLFRDEATTFNGFTRQRRLERCRRLLELSRANAPSIGEIAATVGFGSQAYLNKAFKRSFGTTPGDYRRSFQSRAGEP
ncbi:helix-turn-helix domain-containing protein [Dongia sedimenti]|uniref:Helix-turn-helix domain-containing protein n=1 Tax=Dongia sedimenti TaxID=3064282 RepID=A0ABU0YT78_9PROT|nr:helix-turn-helix domain-containing protein [Rhodospirillaceae bacterium R-7]